MNKLQQTLKNLTNEQCLHIAKIINPSLAWEMYHCQISWEGFDICCGDFTVQIDYGKSRIDYYRNTSILPIPTETLFEIFTYIQTIQMNFQSITDLSKIIYQANVEKGFYDEPRDFPHTCMLVVSEIAEAVEADRKGVPMPTVFPSLNSETFVEEFKGNVKDTIPDEMADAIIRILDWCGKENIPIGYHIEAKLKYNASRPYKHGKTY
jgi:hypothetical protein